MASRARDLANLAKGNLTVDASGDLDVSGIVTADGLGLGTTAPLSLMHLKQTTGNAILKINSDSGERRIDFGDATDNDGGRIKYNSGDEFQFYTGGTEKVRISASGKVGIGTGSPSAKLELNNGGAGSLVTFTDGVNTNFNFSTTSLLGTFGTDAGSTALAFKTTGTERMRIDSLGNLGIGMTNPNSYGRLAVMTPTTGYGYFGIGNSVSGGGGVNIGTYFGTARVSYMDTAVENGTAGSEQSRLTFGTALGGTLSEKMRIDSSGNLTATGNVTAYSDERLKSDITTIDSALDKVTAMRGVTFTKNGEASSGVIAQELEKIAPELVMEGEEYKSVAYGNLVGYLIEAVKELSTKVEELENGYSNHRAG